MKIDNLNIINNIQNSNIKNKEAETDSFKKALEKAQEVGDEKKLKEACAQFETMFVHMLMKNMRNTIVDGGFTEKSYAREMFEGMLDEELAKEVSKEQGIGISKLIYDQLSQNQKKTL